MTGLKKVRIEKRRVSIVCLYVIAVIGYAFWAHMFSIPVHLEVDEELYISMARSFHYDGVFSKNGTVLDYSCILYSMLISLAYYFCSPANVLLGMRLIGVCIMLSAVFPVYLLSERILQHKKYALGVAVLFCLLPSVADVAYCMQETLCYPLFLWLIWLIYRETELGKTEEISWYTFAVAVISMLCYFTKTYMLFAIVAYFLFVLLVGIEKKNYYIWKKILSFGCVCLIICFAFKFLILYINNGIIGENHYSSQFSQLFPISMKTMIAAVSCMIFYFVSWLFYMGVLPVILPFCNRNNYNDTDKKIIRFLFLSVVILIAEIVISIVLTEEGLVLFPHKFLYRYFQVLEVPIIIIFLKGISDFRLPKWLWSLYFLVFGYLGVYFVYIGNGQRTAIIDAPIFLFMENVTKFILPHFNLLVCIASGILTFIGYYIYRNKGMMPFVKFFLYTFCLGIIVFFLIDMFQLPYYTNQVAKGELLEKESLEIADYYMKHKEMYDKVYYIQDKEDRYEPAVYAYLPIEVIFCDEENVDETVGLDSTNLCIAAVHNDTEFSQIPDLQHLTAYKVGELVDK